MTDSLKARIDQWFPYRIFSVAVLLLAIAFAFFGIVYWDLLYFLATIHYKSRQPVPLPDPARIGMGFGVVVAGLVVLAHMLWRRHLWSAPLFSLGAFFLGVFLVLGSISYSPSWILFLTIPIHFTLFIPSCLLLWNLWKMRREQRSQSSRA